MQPVLELGSIDKPLTFDFGLIQLSFIPVCSPNTCTISVKLCRGFALSAFHYHYKPEHKYISTLHLGFTCNTLGGGGFSSVGSHCHLVTNDCGGHWCLGTNWELLVPI